MILQASVCPRAGGGAVCSQGGVCSGGVCSWGVSAPRGVFAPEVSAPGEGLVSPACTEADTPSPGRDGYCCGRYASYWNAFLLLFHFWCLFYFLPETIMSGGHSVYQEIHFSQVFQGNLFTFAHLISQEPYRTDTKCLD